MTELYSVYQNARQERQEFLNRIIPLVLKDANIGNWRGRASSADGIHGAALVHFSYPSQRLSSLSSDRIRPPTMATAAVRSPSDYHRLQR
jgi:hypothetical protein